MPPPALYCERDSSTISVFPINVLSELFEYVFTPLKAECCLIMSLTLQYTTILFMKIKYIQLQYIRLLLARIHDEHSIGNDDTSRKSNDRGGICMDLAAKDGTNRGVCPSTI